MWMLPLYLHVNQKSDYDMMMMVGKLFLFYRRFYELVSKYDTGLKPLLLQGL